MRSKFPSFWVLQFILFTVLGVVSLVAPQSVVEALRGVAAPRTVAKPEAALAEWALRIQRIPRPEEAVQDFFRTTAGDGPEGQPLPVADARTRESLADWLLSSEVTNVEDPIAIRDWLHAIDEIPAPPPALREWVLAMTGPEPPPVELKLMILQARQTVPVSWGLAADQVRLSAACILAAAVFTLFGMLSPPIRRPLARSFVLAILFLTVAMLLSSLGPRTWNLTYGASLGGLILALAMIGTAVRAAPKVSTGRVLWFVLAAWWIAIAVQASQTRHDTHNATGERAILVVTGLLALLGIVNAYYWLIGPSEDPPQDDAGIAQRRPPQLWTLWLVQFVILLIVGFLTLLFPVKAAELFISSDFDYLTTDIVNDSVRLLGAWVIALALFSYFSLGVAQDWVWQGIGWIFCLAFAVLALSTFVNTLPGKYSIWGYAYGFQGVVFIPITLLLLLKQDPWSTENVERIRSHWSLADLTVALALLWKPLWQGRRALYRTGAGARGHLRVLPDIFQEDRESGSVPQHAFFTAGSEFPIEVRFANRTQEDDAALDIRGCAIRFSQSEESPLDLLFQTGAFAPAGCLMDFRRLLPHANVQRNVLKSPTFREGLAAGMRRAPASFASLSFYHPCVLEWQTSDAGHWLVRFRLVPQPGADGADQGLPDAQDLQHLWQQERRSDESRDRRYLRQELHDRLQQGAPVLFQLQAQFHAPAAGDSLDWYNPALEWDERVQTWSPLAEVRLNQPLSEEDSAGLQFDPANLPASLRIPKPDNEASLYDPRSLAAAQFRVCGPLGRLRLRRRPRPTSLYTGDTANAAARDPEQDSD